MASRGVSPGAALLRSSRMFSMPAPIPVAMTADASWDRPSTATTTHPTHQAVITPTTSRLQGDWGFKRPLPAKMTKNKANPTIRIKEIDALEQITDFRTASDHTMSLKKFQELNLPISVPLVSGDTRRTPRSVFEEDRDITALEPGQEVQLESKRWKFKGPWLAGMTDGEFKRWLEKNVRAKRGEFREYLKEAFAKELTKARTADAVKNQQPVPPSVSASDITDEQYMEYLRDVRQDRLVLFRHVSRFLDLAPVATELELLGTLKPNRPQDFDSVNPYSINGPPKTHPSAGISYLRTPSFMENHPIYGPQRYHPMVKARILKPRRDTLGVHNPVIGLAGFVMEPPREQRIGGSSAMNLNPRGRALAQLDLSSRGGSKLFYKVEEAKVGSNGGIRISGSEPPNLTAELVAKELVGECSENEKVYEHSMQDDNYEQSWGQPGTGRFRQRRSHFYSNASTYGLGSNKE
ncbi:hypothetical protein F5Y17DRAFT_434234 [Xylariaceae sp. FL0594]|nr:hypothetical protein F5Y17DRAFT_434234 [Xylariaceae sp. FL0594]